MDIIQKKQIVSEITGLSDGSFNITDSSDDLVIIKLATDDESVQKWNFCIFDLEQKKLICGQAFDDNEVIYRDEIKVDSAGCFNVYENNPIITDVRSTLSNFKIYRGYQGTIIRVFYHKDKVWYTTYSKLNIQGRWVKTRRFDELYDELEGPRDLFDNDLTPKGTVFYFVICHPELQSVSQDNIGTGKIILFHVKYQDPTMIYDDFQLDALKREYSERDITVGEANKILSGEIITGMVNKDSRLSDGGYVYLITCNRTIKLVSSGFNWRETLRNNDPNMDHLICMCLSDSIVKGKYPTTDAEFLKKYIIFKPIDTKDMEEDLIRDGRITFEVADNKELPTDNQGRAHQIIMNLIAMAPPGELGKMAIIKGYKKFFRQRVRLTDFITSLDEDISVFEEIPRELIDSYTKSITRMKQILKASKEVQWGKKKEGKEINLKVPIGGMVSVERGGSLYGMFKLMNTLNIND